MTAFLAWLKAAVAYFSGKSAGATEERNQEVERDAASFKAVAKAAVDAPASPDAVSKRLRDGTF